MIKRRDITRSDVWDQYLRNYFLFDRLVKARFTRRTVIFILSEVGFASKKKQNVSTLLARGEFVNNWIKFSPEEDVLQNILSEC